jgi:uncharacterized membrane protein YphA (DoxX/SURF4 family)
MYQSLKQAQWVLRIGLALVFLWFGIEKFIQPQYWLDAWMPSWAVSMTVAVRATPTELVYLIGMFEVLVAASLVTGFFMRVFATIAAAYLVVVVATHGLNEVLVRDVGLVAGLISLVIWPERNYI